LYDAKRDLLAIAKFFVFVTKVLVIAVTAIKSMLSFSLRTASLLREFCCDSWQTLSTMRTGISGVLQCSSVKLVLARRWPPTTNLCRSSVTGRTSRIIRSSASIGCSAPYIGFASHCPTTWWRKWDAWRSTRWIVTHCVTHATTSFSVTLNVSLTAYGSSLPLLVSATVMQPWGDLNDISSTCCTLLRKSVWSSLTSARSYWERCTVSELRSFILIYATAWCWRTELVAKLQAESRA